MLLSSPRRALQRVPDSAFHVAAQGMELATQTLVGIAAARGLGPASFGSLALGLSVAALTSIVLLFGSADVLLGAYVRKEERPQHLLGASLRIWLRGSATCLSLALLASFLVAHDSATRLSIVASSLVLCLNGLSSLLYLPIVASGAARGDFLGFVTTRVALAALSLLAARSGSLWALQASYLFCASSLVLWRIRCIRRVIEPLRIEHDARCARDISHRSTHVGIGSVFGTLAARADMLLLAGLSTPSAVGLYGACYRIINGFGAAAHALAGALLPQVHRGMHDGRRTHVRRWFLGFPLLGAIVLSLGALFGSTLVGVIYGASFARAGSTMSVLLVASGLQMFSVFLHKWLIATENEVALPVAQSASAVVNVAANLYLIPRMGALGAAIATLCSESALLAVHLVLIIRRRARAAAASRAGRHPFPLAANEVTL